MKTSNWINEAKERQVNSESRRIAFKKTVRLLRKKRLQL